MRNHLKSSARSVGFALLAISFGALSATAAPVNGRGLPAYDVTEADVIESNDELEKAYGALVAMWTEDFRAMGRRFVAPRIVNYRGTVRTSCGIMRAGNAAYCGGMNVIYFDEVFLARQRKEAARVLRTDGDMAGIGVIAHEVGHAVARQLGVESRIPYENEAMADCLAGSFARQAERGGQLQEGDLDEAFAGLAAAGDPEIPLTGNRRVDERRKRTMQVMGHGTGEQRMANFRAGYRSGTRACF
jgi:predicted metalloprotease